MPKRKIKSVSTKHALNKGGTSPVRHEDVILAIDDNPDRVAESGSTPAPVADSRGSRSKPSQDHTTSNKTSAATKEESRRAPVADSRGSRSKSSQDHTTSNKTSAATKEESRRASEKAIEALKIVNEWQYTPTKIVLDKARRVYETAYG